MSVSNVSELILDMGAGWNLGNTFDCNVQSPNRTDLYALARSTPTSWGTPSTKTWFFDAIKHAGFNTVRMPVTWSDHVDPVTNIIDREYFEYINEFVNHIVNNLGMYCIINMHHDDRIWFNANTMVSDPAIMQKYTYLWNQIATYFKDYSYKLIFAGLNEPLDSVGGWDNAGSASLSNVNTIHQNFVTTVRSVTGNENRYLCCNTYASKVYALKTLVLPDDKCFADVHIYSSDASNIKATIDQASGYGKPYIIGEFGIGKDGFSSVASVASQCFMLTYARTKGVCGVLWDDYGGMQFLKRDKVTPSNYKDAQNFNGYLIGLPRILVDSHIVKTSELQVSTRNDNVGVGKTVDVYPSSAQLDKITYNFSSDTSVAKFSEGVTSNRLTGIKNGQVLISSYSPYGYLAQKLISVGGQNSRVLDNYTISLQNINNWHVTLSRVVDVLPSNPYIIKCPIGYNITLEELNTNNEVAKTTLMSEDYSFKTSIVTKKLKISIQHVTQKDYDTLSRDFGNNLIDMSILYSKYQDEVVTEYNELNNVVPCDSIILSKNSYSILSDDVALDLNNYMTLIPANTTQIVRFNAVDPSIANVSLNGVVTPLKEGTTNIIIRCGNKSAELSVIVDYSAKVAKVKLNAIMQEQLYVQNMMVLRGITNADKIELDSLIATSNALNQSSTALSSEINRHIAIVKEKLFLFSNRNSIFYKYLTSIAVGADSYKLTNMLLDNTKKLVITFGYTASYQYNTLISGNKFSIRYEHKDLRIVVDGQGFFDTGKIPPGPSALYTLEICKDASAVNRAIVLNDVVLNPVIGANVPANNPLSVNLINNALRLFNIKVYDYATNTLLYDLMPVQVDDRLALLDVVNNVKTEIGTTSTHKLENFI